MTQSSKEECTTPQWYSVPCRACSAAGMSLRTPAKQTCMRPMWTVLASWASAAATAQAAGWPPAWLGSATQACRPARLLRPRNLPTTVMPRIAWTVLRHNLPETVMLNPQGQGSRQGRCLPRAEWACARRALGVLWVCRWMGQRFSMLLLAGGTPCFWLMTARATYARSGCQPLMFMTPLLHGGQEWNGARSSLACVTHPPEYNQYRCGDS